jgi:LmbE family N-acetylglucosaminyl deacetylase
VRALSALFAHPDDETFATGATLAGLASGGARISLYCATDGDAGRSSGIPVASRAELGALRRDELRAAAAILGIGAVTFGGHADGALAAADPDVVIGEMVALLRRERPAVVVTFGPEGAPTAHRDHRAVSRLATAAVLLAATRTAFPDQVAAGLAPHRASRLFYVTWPTPKPGDRYQVEGQPIDVRVPARDRHATKLEAFLAHRTQRQHREAFEAAGLTDEECYCLAHGTPVPPAATDLFAGLPPR